MHPLTLPPTNPAAILLGLTLGVGAVLGLACIKLAPVVVAAVWGVVG